MFISLARDIKFEIPANIYFYDTEEAINWRKKTPQKTKKLKKIKM